MKQTKRAERRHHNARLISKRYKQELRYWYGFDLVKHQEWAMWRARKRLHTNVPCSCLMCASERKYHGNGRSSRTFQERRAIDSMREDLIDWAVDNECNYPIY